VERARFLEEESTLIPIRWQIYGSPVKYLTIAKGKTLEELYQG
jgi:hypothetical protein